MNGRHHRRDLNQSLQQLYPERRRVPLHGLYLCEDLRAHTTDDAVYIYSNFITSLDGRIALGSPGSDDLGVPRHTANARDWRLVLELAAPADAVVISGRFLRQLGAGTAQAWPPFSGNAPEDLLAFRAELGLAPQPTVVVLSRSLDLPTKALTALRNRRVIVAAGDAAPAERVAAVRATGAEVLHAGAESVDGRRLSSMLAERGLRLIYSIAGPQVLHTLLSAGVLSRIYITTVLRVLSGTNYATLASGPLLEPPYDFVLAGLYLDSHGPDGVEQMLQVFDRQP
jgi:riboflavin biosynthesis pyrimidine reductase